MHIGNISAKNGGLSRKRRRYTDIKEREKKSDNRWEGKIEKEVDKQTEKKRHTETER